MLAYKVENKYVPAAYEDIRLAGAIGALFDRFIENRITGDFAVNVVLKEAEDAFFENVDDKDAPLGLWRGEFWGKLMIGACRVAKYRQDEKLCSIIKNSVYKILSTADDNGYIGSYKDPRMVLPCPRDWGKKVRGAEIEWCWNIWCRKYTLWGLLEAYALLGDSTILAAAEKFTDQLIGMLEEMNIHICETGTFKGVASASILKPVLILYRHTENKRYLEFALKIADGFQNDTTNCAKLIKRALDKLPIYRWNCQENADRFSANSHKAYETMSCFDGILELYRITGDETYLKASENFWELLMEQEWNPLMSVGFNDLFLGAARQLTAVSEPCDVIHFIRITGELYKLTGGRKYMDALELSFENALLASIHRDGKWGVRGLRGNSWHFSAVAQCDLKYNHCCVNNLPRGILNAAEMIAVRRGEDIYINLYTPSAVTVGETEIQISEGYIQNQQLTVQINAPTDVNIYFRNPGWSHETSVNGTTVPAAETYFKAVAKKGANVFKLCFDTTLRVVAPSVDATQVLPSEYMLRRLRDSHDKNPDILPVTENKLRLMVGPLLLARSRQLGSTYEEMFTGKSMYTETAKGSATPVENPNVRAAFAVTLDGNRFLAGDYAWSSNLNEEEMFSIYF